MSIFRRNVLSLNIADALPIEYTKLTYITCNTAATALNFGVKSIECGKMYIKFSCSDTSKEDVFWGCNGNFFGYVGKTTMSGTLNMSVTPNISNDIKGDGQIHELLFTNNTTADYYLSIGWKTNGYKTIKNWFLIEMYDKGENKIRRLIPCIENSSGYKGFYDVIGKTFYDGHIMFP